MPDLTGNKEMELDFLMELVAAGHTLRKDKGSLLYKSRQIIDKMVESEMRWLKARSMEEEDITAKFYKGDIESTLKGLTEFMFSKDNKFQWSKDSYMLMGNKVKIKADISNYHYGENLVKAMIKPMVDCASSKTSLYSSGIEYLSK